MAALTKASSLETLASHGSNMRGGGRKRSRCATHSTSISDMEYDDVIQFASAFYFCNENEGQVKIDIVRMGKAAGFSSVQFTTTDGSACAGDKYIAVTTRIDFQPGETHKEVVVTLMQDDSFDATLEFEADLWDVVGASLGLYLYKCRIVVADDDTFPTNRFSALLTAGRLEQIPQWSLLREFIRMNLNDKAIRCRVIIAGVISQMDNLNMAWTVYLTNYLVDTLLKPSDGNTPDHVDELVLGVVLCLAVPHLLLWFADQQVAALGLRGRSIDRLQSNLMRKFLNYNEQSARLVSTSDLTMAISRDVPELVDNGFMTIFKIIKSLGMVIILTYMGLLQAEDKLATAALVGSFPIPMFFFMLVRDKGTQTRELNVFQCQTSIITYVQHITDQKRLIIDYFQRPNVVKSFVQAIRVCNTAIMRQCRWGLTNFHFAPFLTSIAIGIYVLMSFKAVLGDQGKPIGEFMTGMAICRGIGQGYQSIYLGMLQLQQSRAPLQNVVFYMNLANNVPERMEISRQQLSDGAVARKCAREKLFGTLNEPCPMLADSLMMQAGEFSEPVIYPSDLMQIWGENVTFQYKLGAGNIKELGPPVLDNACFHIPQGKLVAVTGHHKGGKSTLLQLLGGVLFPTAAEHWFVPPFLRVLHVAATPARLPQLTATENLCFGVRADSPDRDAERIMGIGRRIGMHNKLLSLVAKDLQNHEGGDWTTRIHQQKADPTGTPASVAQRNKERSKIDDHTRLSHNDVCEMHLARALIMNPEVMVLHRPLSFFEPVQKRMILDTLREFVDFRGILKPPETIRNRRPRTCIFSLRGTEDTLQYSQVADLVLHVRDGKVVEEDVASLKRLKKLKEIIFALFNERDAGGGKRVTQEEFVKVASLIPNFFSVCADVETCLTTPQFNSDVAGLNELFKLIDTSGSGVVRVSGLVEWFHYRFQERLDLLLDVLEGGRDVLVPREEISHCASTFGAFAPMSGGHRH